MEEVQFFLSLLLAVQHSHPEHIEEICCLVCVTRNLAICGDDMISLSVISNL